MIESFPPVADAECRVLILGTMPSVKSLEAHHFYAHPQNAFWRIMDRLLGGIPEDFPGRYEALLARHIALWDVIRSCEREGSLDSRIRNPVPNDIPGLLARCPEISAVCLNGGTAARLYTRFFGDLSLRVYKLPSTSPAAAMYSFEKKLEAWSVLRTLW